MVIEPICRAITHAAREMHRLLGPNRTHKVYRSALCHELKSRSLAYRRDLPLALRYKGALIDSGNRLELLVEDQVVVEICMSGQLESRRLELGERLRWCGKALGLLLAMDVPVFDERAVSQVCASAPVTETPACGTNACGTPVH